MNVQIEESWKACLEPEFEKDYFHTLTDFVAGRIQSLSDIPSGKIFNAFNLCPFDKVKVVISVRTHHGPGSWFMLFCERRSSFPSFH